MMAITTPPSGKLLMQVFLNIGRLTWAQYILCSKLLSNGHLNMGLNIGLMLVWMERHLLLRLSQEGQWIIPLVKFSHSQP
jgi:hypothetical protein